jgi:cysteine-rich repeat protein
VEAEYCNSDDDLKGALSEATTGAAQMCVFAKCRVPKSWVSQEGMQLSPSSWCQDTLERNGSRDVSVVHENGVLSQVEMFLDVDSGSDDEPEENLKKQSNALNHMLTASKAAASKALRVIAGWDVRHALDSHLSRAEAEYWSDEAKDAAKGTSLIIGKEHVPGWKLAQEITKNQIARVNVAEEHEKKQQQENDEEANKLSKEEEKLNAAKQQAIEAQQTAQHEVEATNEEVTEAAAETSKIFAEMKQVKDKERNMKVSPKIPQTPLVTESDVESGKAKENVAKRELSTMEAEEARFAITRKAKMIQSLKKFELVDADNKAYSGVKEKLKNEEKEVKAQSKAKAKALKQSQDEGEAATKQSQKTAADVASSQEQVEEFAEQAAHASLKSHTAQVETKLRQAMQYQERKEQGEELEFHTQQKRVKSQIADFEKAAHDTEIASHKSQERMLKHESDERTTKTREYKKWEHKQHMKEDDMRHSTEMQLAHLKRITNDEEGEHSRLEEHTRKMQYEAARLKELLLLKSRKYRHPGVIPDVEGTSSTHDEVEVLKKVADKEIAAKNARDEARQAARDVRDQTQELQVKADEAHEKAIQDEGYLKTLTEKYAESQMAGEHAESTERSISAAQKAAQLSKHLASELRMKTSESEKKELETERVLSRARERVTSVQEKKAKLSYILRLREKNSGVLKVALADAIKRKHAMANIARDESMRMRKTLKRVQHDMAEMQEHARDHTMHIQELETDLRKAKATELTQKDTIKNMLPVDCKYTSWSAWGQCSAQCGIGSHSRKRIVERKSKNGGTPCDRPLTETQQCKTKHCEVCGDGVQVNKEECDDGNSAQDDGCDEHCKIESGFSCTGGSESSASTCDKCGNGKQIGAERCDDGNEINGDGCSSTCTIESGFVCTSKVAAGLSVCTKTSTWKESVAQALKQSEAACKQHGKAFIVTDAQLGTGNCTQWPTQVNGMFVGDRGSVWQTYVTSSRSQLSAPSTAQSVLGVVLTENFNLPSVLSAAGEEGAAPYAVCETRRHQVCASSNGSASMGRHAASSNRQCATASSTRCVEVCVDVKYCEAADSHIKGTVELRGHGKRTNSDGKVCVFKGCRVPPSWTPLDGARRLDPAAWCYSVAVDGN